MFIPYSDPAVRLTGRFYKENNAVSTTACGSHIEAAVYGDWTILYFDMTDLTPSFPQIYIQIDDGELVGSSVGSRIYLRMKEKKEHIIKIIFKGACEKQNRWYAPVQAKISFEGLEADAAGTLPADNRKTITFIGDSITEGILIHPEQTPFKDNLRDRVYQDDVTRTYAWIIAKHFNLRPAFCAYGAVGMTKSGSGEVPKFNESYPWCVEGKEFVDPYQPDYIMINHGCNDRGHTAEEYIEEYEKCLDMLRKRYPAAKIIMLSAFIGAHAVELKEFHKAYNEKNGTDIVFIDSTGWVPEKPTHPLVAGHETIAHHLIDKLTKII